MRNGTASGKPRTKNRARRDDRAKIEEHFRQMKRRQNLFIAIIHQWDRWKQNDNTHEMKTRARKRGPTSEAELDINMKNEDDID